MREMVIVLLALAESTSAFRATPPLPLALRLRATTVNPSAEVPSAVRGAPQPSSRSIIAEMRSAAMKLHSRPPRAAKKPTHSGDAEATAHSKKALKKAPMMNVSAWSPSRDAFVQYLVDSQHVYLTFERLILTRPALALALHGTGLARHAALDDDLLRLGVAPRAVHPASADAAAPTPCVPSAAALAYADAVLAACERGGAPAFACHYYNHYFAHTAGGRMIGRRMQELFDVELAFYSSYPHGGVDECVERAKAALEELARGWNERERAACTAETAAAFQGSGALLRQLAVFDDMGFSH